MAIVSLLSNPVFLLGLKTRNDFSFFLLPNNTWKEELTTKITEQFFTISSSTNYIVDICHYSVNMNYFVVFHTLHILKDY